MRTPTLVIAVLLGGLVLLPPTLRAEEDAPTRLEQRVEMLLDLVADLKAEVRALRDRVAVLEATIEAGKATVVVDSGWVRVEPTKPVEPVEPTEPVPLIEPAQPIEPVEPTEPAQPADPAEPAVFPEGIEVGSYVIDREASIEAIAANMLTGTETAEEAYEIYRMVTTEFEDVEMKVHLQDDGTFRAELYRQGEKEHAARGTWRRDGTPQGEGLRLLIATTHENGEEVEEPSEIAAIWKDDRFRLEEEDEDEDFVLILRKE